MRESERRRLEAGVVQGIITPAQRDALAALEVDRGPEAAPGLSGINVAYGIGALFVLFAAGWFLVSQWRTLGGTGVVVVAGAYAAVLVVAGGIFRRRGYARAADLSHMLAIAIMPLVTWGLLRAAGWWPAADAGNPLWQARTPRFLRWLALDLSALLAGLVAWRARRFPLLLPPLAVAGWWLIFHLGRYVGAGSVARYDLWVMMVAATTLLAVADGVDRWQRRAVAPPEGDFAGPMWGVAAVAFGVSFMAMWMEIRSIRHVMVPVAAALIGLALRTRRRSLLAIGVLGVFVWLAWLANDVFDSGAAFPAVLAGLGIALIATTVWLQRRFPALARRVGGDDGRPLPWPWWSSWLPVAFAIGMAATRVVGKP